MNHTLTAIGHAKIKVGGRAYRLAPTLSAIASLPDPVKTFADAHGQDVDAALDACRAVLVACSDSPDIANHIGQQQVGKTRAKPDGRGGFITTRIYADSYIDNVALVVIGRDLLYHGMIGRTPTRPQPKKAGGYSGAFKAEEYAAAAMAHLGMDRQSAWSMTMTELMQAMHQKFPPSAAEQAQIKALDEYEQAMAWRKRIYGDSK